MARPENQRFHQGFAHAYPASRGLVETLRMGQRILIEPLPVVDATYPILKSSSYPLFPSRIKGTNREHLLPDSSRDLANTLRVAQFPDQLAGLGRLLGLRVQRFIELTGSMPEDTVIGRYAVHSDTSQSATDGINLTLLAPFDRYTLNASPEEARLLIVADLETVSWTTDRNIGSFMEGVDDGFNAPR